MWIKVCGIRDRQTAREVAQSEIDAIGLNFYANSPRFVTTDEAMEISNLIPVRIERIGVFVNHSIRSKLPLECGAVARRRVAFVCGRVATAAAGNEIDSCLADVDGGISRTGAVSGRG